MCGLKQLASKVFPESWKVLAELRRRRRRKQRKRTKNNKSPGYPGWVKYNFPELKTRLIHCVLVMPYNITELCSTQSPLVQVMVSCLHQAIISTNADLLLIGPSETNFREIWKLKNIFHTWKVHLKMSSTKWWPFHPGLNELTLLVLKPEYSRTIRVMPWLLMHWLLASPSHQEL